MTMLLQYKSSNYEVAVKAAKDAKTDEDFLYRTYYKKVALLSLEAAIGVNVICLYNFWFWIYPNLDDEFSTSTLGEGFTESFESTSYYKLRSVIVNTLPFYVCLLSVFLSDVIIMETDWYVHMMTTFTYMLVNFAISEYSGIKEVFYLDWTTQANIMPFGPLFTTLTYFFIACGMHFFLSVSTQILN